MKNGILDLLNLQEVDGSNNERTENISKKDIAIIGISLRFPAADNTRTFWENLQSGVDSITDISQERAQDLEKYFGRKVSCASSGYIDDIDKFDSEFFNIRRKEAVWMDPTQRIFLEMVWHALEDAGYGAGQLKGSRTGVYLGYRNDELHDYKKMLKPINPIHLWFPET